MTTIMPGDKNLRNSIAWIQDHRLDEPDVRKLVAQAATKFDLTPKNTAAARPGSAPEARAD